MSRQSAARQQQAAPAPTAPARPARLSDSVPLGPMKLAGMVRTANGYAVAEVEVSEDGKLTVLRLDNSERFPEYVARRAKARQLALAQECQARGPQPVGMQKLIARRAGAGE